MVQSYDGTRQSMKEASILLPMQRYEIYQREWRTGGVSYHTAYTWSSWVEKTRPLDQNWTWLLTWLAHPSTRYVFYSLWLVFSRGQKEKEKIVRHHRGQGDHKGRRHEDSEPNYARTSNSDFEVPRRQQRCCELKYFRAEDADPSTEEKPRTPLGGGYWRCHWKDLPRFETLTEWSFQDSAHWTLFACSNNISNHVFIPRIDLPPARVSLTKNSLFLWVTVLFLLHGFRNVNGLAVRFGFERCAGSKS